MATGLQRVSKCISFMQTNCIRACSGIILSIFIVLSASAAEDHYHFETPAEEKRFQQFIVNVKCMVCENQSISESNAPLAEDLRMVIYKQMVMGKSDQEIKEFLVARYGPEIWYNPPVQKNTLILWLTPLALFTVGLIFWLLIISKSIK